MFSQPIVWKVAALLFVSNTFMTFAWYGHLKYLHGRALPLVVLISWGIAFFEYCFAVPANRIGSGALSGFQLKIIQEIVTLTVFIGFARLVPGGEAALEPRRQLPPHRRRRLVRLRLLRQGCREGPSPLPCGKAALGALLRNAYWVSKLAVKVWAVPMLVPEASRVVPLTTVR